MTKKGAFVHSTVYRQEPGGGMMTISRAVREEASGGASGYSEPYDLEDFADDTETSIVTFTIKRCVHQVGLSLFGSVLTDLEGEIDYSSVVNWDVYVKIDTADDFTPVEIVAYEQGTAIPADDIADGQYYFRALYGIGVDEAGNMGVAVDLRNALLPLLA